MIRFPHPFSPPLNLYRIRLSKAAMTTAGGTGAIMTHTERAATATSPAVLTIRGAMIALQTTAVMAESLRSLLAMEAGMVMRGAMKRATWQSVAEGEGMTRGSTMTMMVMKVGDTALTVVQGTRRRGDTSAADEEAVVVEFTMRTSVWPTRRGCREVADTCMRMQLSSSRESTLAGVAEVLAKAKIMKVR